MWWYTLATLVLWVVNPEIRRVFGWSVGYPAFDVFPLLPFLAVLPHVWSLTYGGGWLRLPRLLLIATWLWLGGFGYAFVVAIVEGNLLPGSYAFAEFVLPIGIGLWIAADETPFEEAYGRLTRLFFALTTVISLYGIVQYIFAPEWDKLWLQQAIQGGSLSFGRPAPFQIRVFSMLSSPGPFGNFMALMLLLALPQLSLRRPVAIAQVPIWLVAFGLSLDRSGWILFAFGSVVYLLLTPRRWALLATAGLSAAMLAGLVVVLPAAIGNDAVLSSLNERLASFNELDSDRSGKDRVNLYDSGLSLVSETPFGQGLGVLGTATKLGSSAATTDVDSGILARLVEMGIPGASLFVATFILLATGLCRVWRQAELRRDQSLQSFAAMAFAVLLSLLETEVFGDVTGLLILTLWLICGLTLRADSPDPTRLRNLYLARV